MRTAPSLDEIMLMVTSLEEIAMRGTKPRGALQAFLVIQRNFGRQTIYPYVTQQLARSQESEGYMRSLVCAVYDTAIQRKASHFVISLNNVSSIG